MNFSDMLKEINVDSEVRVGSWKNKMYSLTIVEGVFFDSNNKVYVFDIFDFQSTDWEFVKLGLVE